uniref:Inhibitory synaptic factor 2A n=1 Tax=Callorhinchus milii TaxID=7868 RepID=A0A4W3JTP4_CALMI|eukprot:gi/632937237/ref/XP_007897810.1/ PREDICTED: protein FAM196A [Callorhinchus milii]
MVSKEASKCPLTSAENEVEQAASQTVEMKYALDPNRHIRKRNKALQVRFKDICEAQNEQDKNLLVTQQLDKKALKTISYKAAYRKYMTVPARRSIPNVTRSTGVQTSPDLKKRYQTFPLERKKGNVIKIAPTLEAFRRQNNGLAVKDNNLNEDSGEHFNFSGTVSNQKSPNTSSHGELSNLQEQAGSEHSDNSGNMQPEKHGCTEEPSPLLSLTDSNPTEQDNQLPNKANQDKVPSSGNQNFNQSAHSNLQLTEFTSFHLTETNSEPAQLSNSFTKDNPQHLTVQEEHERTLQPTGLCSQSDNGQICAEQEYSGVQSSEECPEPLLSDIVPIERNQPSQTSVSVINSNRQIVPLTETVDLKAQLQIMENLINSSQETIKVLLGVIQELEKGEALREGLSYRTGQDTANCDTCRNSACIIYSVELDFKQQEDKFQPILRKLHPNEETQVSTLPYSQEFCPSAYQKQKSSKTESKKHGKWKLWFL